MLQKRLLLFFVFLITGLILTQLEAQSIRRQTIGSFGSSDFSYGFLIRETVGQPFSTSPYNDRNLTVNPGFQQPYSLKKAGNIIREDMKILSIYPNPASSFITLTSTSELSEALLSVTDPSGKIILNKIIHNFITYTILCDEWPEGLYVIMVTENSGNSRFISKIIITK